MNTQRPHTFRKCKYCETKYWKYSTQWAYIEESSDRYVCKACDTERSLPQSATLTWKPTPTKDLNQ
jgi:hypothetical protein